MAIPPNKQSAFKYNKNTPAENPHKHQKGTLAKTLADEQAILDENAKRQGTKKPKSVMAMFGDTTWGKTSKDNATVRQAQPSIAEQGITTALAYGGFSFKTQAFKPANPQEVKSYFGTSTIVNIGNYRKVVNTKFPVADIQNPQTADDYYNLQRQTFALASTGLTKARLEKLNTNSDEMKNLGVATNFSMKSGQLQVHSVVSTDRGLQIYGQETSAQALSTSEPLYMNVFYSRYANNPEQVQDALNDYYAFLNDNQAEPVNELERLKFEQRRNEKMHTIRNALMVNRDFVLQQHDLEYVKRLMSFDRDFRFEYQDESDLNYRPNLSYEKISYGLRGQFDGWSEKEKRYLATMIKEFDKVREQDKTFDIGAGEFDFERTVKSHATNPFNDPDWILKNANQYCNYHRNLVEFERNLLANAMPHPASSYTLKDYHNHINQQAKTDQAEFAQRLSTSFDPNLVERPDYFAKVLDDDGNPVTDLNTGRPVSKRGMNDPTPNSNPNFHNHHTVILDSVDNNGKKVRIIVHKDTLNDWIKGGTDSLLLNNLNAEQLAELEKQGGLDRLNAEKTTENSRRASYPIATMVTYNHISDNANALSRNAQGNPVINGIGSHFTDLTDYHTKRLAKLKTTEIQPNKDNSNTVVYGTGAVLYNVKLGSKVLPQQLANSYDQDRANKKMSNLNYTRQGITGCDIIQITNTKYTSFGVVNKDGYAGNDFVGHKGYKNDTELAQTNLGEHFATMLFNAHVPQATTTFLGQKVVQNPSDTLIVSFTTQSQRQEVVTDEHGNLSTKTVYDQKGFPLPPVIIELGKDGVPTRDKLLSQIHYYDDPEYLLNKAKTSILLAKHQEKIIELFSPNSPLYDTPLSNYFKARNALSSTDEQLRTALENQNKLNFQKTGTPLKEVTDDDIAQMRASLVERYEQEQKNATESLKDIFLNKKVLQSNGLYSGGIDFGFDEILQTINTPASVAGEPDRKKEINNIKTNALFLGAYLQHFNFTQAKHGYTPPTDKAKIDKIRQESNAIFNLQKQSALLSQENAKYENRAVVLSALLSQDSTTMSLLRNKLGLSIDDVQTKYSNRLFAKTDPKTGETRIEQYTKASFEREFFTKGEPIQLQIFKRNENDDLLFDNSGQPILDRVVELKNYDDFTQEVVATSEFLAMIGGRESRQYQALACMRQLDNLKNGKAGVQMSTARKFLAENNKPNQHPNAFVLGDNEILTANGETVSLSQILGNTDRNQASIYSELLHNNGKLNTEHNINIIAGVSAGLSMQVANKTTLDALGEKVMYGRAMSAYTNDSGIGLDLSISNTSNLANIRSMDAQADDLTALERGVMAGITKIKGVKVIEQGLVIEQDKDGKSIVKEVVKRENAFVASNMDSGLLTLNNFSYAPTNPNANTKDKTLGDIAHTMTMNARMASYAQKQGTYNENNKFDNTLANTDLAKRGVAIAQTNVVSTDSGYLVKEVKLTSAHNTCTNRHNPLSHLTDNGYTFDDEFAIELIKNSMRNGEHTNKEPVPFFNKATGKTERAPLSADFPNDWQYAEFEIGTNKDGTARVITGKEILQKFNEQVEINKNTLLVGLGKFKQDHARYQSTTDFYLDNKKQLELGAFGFESEQAYQQALEQDNVLARVLRATQAINPYVSAMSVDLASGRAVKNDNNTYQRNLSKEPKFQISFAIDPRKGFWVKSNDENNEYGFATSNRMTLSPEQLGIKPLSQNDPNYHIQLTNKPQQCVVRDENDNPTLSVRNIGNLTITATHGQQPYCGQKDKYGVTICGVQTGGTKYQIAGYNTNSILNAEKYSDIEKNNANRVTLTTSKSVESGLFASHKETVKRLMGLPVKAIGNKCKAFVSVVGELIKAKKQNNQVSTPLEQLIGENTNTNTANNVQVQENQAQATATADQVKAPEPQVEQVDKIEPSVEMVAPPPPSVKSTVIPVAPSNQAEQTAQTTPIKPLQDDDEVVDLDEIPNQAPARTSKLTM